MPPIAHTHHGQVSMAWKDRKATIEAVPHALQIAKDASQIEDALVTIFNGDKQHWTIADVRVDTVENRGSCFVARVTVLRRWVDEKGKIQGRTHNARRIISIEPWVKV